MQYTDFKSESSCFESCRYRFVTSEHLNLSMVFRVIHFLSAKNGALNWVSGPRKSVPLIKVSQRRGSTEIENIWMSKGIRIKIIIIIIIIKINHNYHKNYPRILKGISLKAL